MLSRTTEYPANGARTLNPALQKLQPEQRLRLEKSSQKVGKVLGTMPLIDIIPASPRTPGAPAVSQDAKQGKKRSKFGMKSKEKAPGFSVPILRYKLTPLRRTSTRRGSRPTSHGAAVVQSLALELSQKPFRKPIPDSLNLGEPVWRTAADTSYSRTAPRESIFISPLSPLSPFSPIETSDMREQKYHGLRRLARTSRAFRDTIIEELPALVQSASASQVDHVDSYLDLYRMAIRRRNRDSQVYTACTNLDTAYTAYTNCTDLNSAYTAYTACTPIESESARRRHRRRSTSLSYARHSILTTTTTSTTPVARTSFIVPLSASVYSASIAEEHSRQLSRRSRSRSARYTLVIKVPGTPRTPAARAVPYTAGTTRSDIDTTRASYTLVLNVPQKKDSLLPETPVDDDDDAPLQKQQREARARAVVLARSTAKLVSLPSRAGSSSQEEDLEEVEVGEGEEADDASSLPWAVQTPLVKLQARSPRVPYWVRSSSSYRMSANGYVRRTHSYSRRSGMRVPPTPKTVRRERRQGWGGEWREGKMAAAVEELRLIRTPAPAVQDNGKGKERQEQEQEETREGV